MKIPDATRDANRLVAAVNLANEAATGEVVAALRAAGLRGIVLKGPLLSRWLYDDAAHRPSMDVDLLVPWDTLEAVETVLPRLGWRYLGIDAVGEDRPHCRIWERPETGMLLEIHRSIAGVGAPPAEVWGTLSSEIESAILGGIYCDVLDVPARALHVALHAAQHGRGSDRTLSDLERALERLPLPVWDRAAELAVALEAMPAFAAGLALCPEGKVLVQRMDIGTPASTAIALRASTSPRMAEGLDWLASRRGIRGKVRFVLRHLFPPPGYMRVWSRQARRGRLGLASAYVWRPLWLVWHAFPALRAWWNARRVVKCDS